MNVILNAFFFFALSILGRSLSAQTYCTPQGNCSIGDEINNFSTTGGITNISNLNSGCSTNEYDYIQGQEVTLPPAGSFNFTVQSSPTYGQGFRIWVDWNNDGDFTDPGEDVWNSGSAATTPFSGNITAPAGATPGTLRMRVRCDYFTVPTNPCATQSYGETEDYDLVILPGAQNDAGVASIDSPNVFCPGAHNVVATIQNYGSNQITSVDVEWEVNGVSQPTFSYTGTLDTVGGTGSTTAQVNLGSYTFTNAAYNVKAWTDQPNSTGDTINFNDTIIATIQSNLPPPTNLSVAGTGSTTALITWNGGSANSWLYLNVPAGTPPTGLGTSVTNPNATISGLTQASSYDFYVREVCPTGDTSTWAGPLNYYTLVELNCGGGNTESVFIENWTSGQGSWTGDFGTSNGDWQFNSGTTTSSNTGPSGPHSGTQYLHYEASGNGSPGSASVITPAIDLTGGVLEASLSYWMHAYGSDVPGSNFEVRVSNSPSGPFTMVDSIVFSSELQNAENDPFVRQVVNLDAYLGQTIYLEFYYNLPNSFSADLAIDQIEVFTCGLPSAPNDAGIFAIDAPMDSVYCDTPEDIDVEIMNFGTEVLDSAMIHVAVGTDTLPAYSFTGPLDTLTGTGPNTQVVTVGNYPFTQSGFYDIKVWTTLPNGQVDTVNLNDTATKTVFVKLMDLQTTSVTEPLCSGDPTGSISVTSTAVNPTYLWFHGPQGNVVTGLPGGTYTVVVTGDLSCPDTLDVVINEPDPLTYNLVDGGSVSCNGDIDGSLEIEGDGGTPPYTYFWANGTPGNRIDNQPPGQYDVTVTDSNNCEAELTIDIIDPDPLVINEDSVVNASCFGYNDATIALNATGGTTPYTWNWNTGDTTGVLGNIVGGATYDVTLVDANGCEDEADFTITQPDQLDTNVVNTHGSLLTANYNFGGASFEWWDCDLEQIVAGETNREFEPTDNGNYAMIITIDDCRDTSNCHVLNRVSTGDLTDEANNFTIYPNPNNGLFNVRLTGNGDTDTHLQIVDMQGKVLTDKKLGRIDGELVEEVNLNLAAGVYFVKVIRDGNLSVKRVIVQ